MKSWILRGIGGAGLIATLATGAIAQVSENRVAANTDWSVFTEESPKECWVVSAPKQSVITENGQPVSAQRGDIRLFVTYRPGSSGVGEVSFSGGYPFASGSTVALDISGRKFDLFTDGEWAWSGSRDDDGAIVAAMKAGASAILVGNSSRGKTTTDTFSLLGFTASVDDAAKRCAD